MGLIYLLGDIYDCNNCCCRELRVNTIILLNPKSLVRKGDGVTDRKLLWPPPWPEMHCE